MFLLMKEHFPNPRVAIVTDATGQDGYLLTKRLPDEGWRVHASVRRPEVLGALASSLRADGRLQTYTIDLLEPSKFLDLVAGIQPEELYKLAGYSSVSASFPIL
jgi:GDP-D-mannose dehydratase